MNFYKTTASAITAIATAALLGGCAGTDFKRPEPDSLKLGQSHGADVTRVMGDAKRKGEVLVNGQTVKQSIYAYANTTGDSLYPGVTGARTLVLSTWNDLLVGDVFVSSFKQDGTDFDEKNVQQIVKGTSTKANVVALLGQPGGKAIYPFVKTQGNTAMIYAYTQVTGSAFNMKIYQKNLTVELDPQDTVVDVAYTASGNK